MSKPPMFDKKTHRSEGSLPKKDRAAELFDAMFASPQKPSASQSGPVSVKRPFTFAEESESKDKTEGEKRPRADFISQAEQKNSESATQNHTDSIPKVVISPFLRLTDGVQVTKNIQISTSRKLPKSGLEEKQASLIETHRSEESLPKKDRAAELFDAIFANPQKPSTSQSGPVNVKRPSTFAKESESEDKTEGEKRPKASFLSSVDKFSGLEKVEQPSKSNENQQKNSESSMQNHTDSIPKVVISPFLRLTGGKHVAKSIKISTSMKFPKSGLEEKQRSLIETHRSDGSLPKKDRAAELFDAMFANPQKPSTSQSAPVNVKRPSTFAKESESDDKTEGEKRPRASFLSSVDKFSGLEKVEQPCKSNENQQKKSESSTQNHTDSIPKVVISPFLRFSTSMKFAKSGLEDDEKSIREYTSGVKATYLQGWSSPANDKEKKRYLERQARLLNADWMTNFRSKKEQELQEKEDETAASGSGPSGAHGIKVGSTGNRFRDAEECLKSGEEDDFAADVQYILSTLLEHSSSNNMRCLSVISLAKKCVSSNFRRFFCSRDLFSRTLKALPDASHSSSLALCVSTVVYLLSRDTTAMPVDKLALYVFAQFLPLDQPDKTEECAKYTAMIMDVFKLWRERSFTNVDPKKIQFDINEKTLTPSFLILESLVYICARKHRDQSLQIELNRMGILQWMVLKIDKTTVQMMLKKLSSEDLLVNLKILERCCRVLESALICNLRNCAYLTNLRDSILIDRCAWLMKFFFKNIERIDNDELKEQNITCLQRMIGLLLSLSYENELCCSKLGQTDDFLKTCVSSFTYLIPKCVRKERQFDLIVLLCSLMVNLLERCIPNRRKLIGLSVLIYDDTNKKVKERPTLKALTQRFVYHESVARTLDEDLDNDLVLEDATDDETTHDDEVAEDDGRLHRLPATMSEDQIVEAVQGAMNKASSHMEDSVLASYLALLIGCMLHKNEGSATEVKAEMKDGKLVTLVEQLQRFVEFMELTHGRTAHVRFMENIADLLDTLNG